MDSTATIATDRVNILLVDDQPSKLLTYEAILSGLNEHLIKASSATEALECLLKNEIAIVLVDVCMPDLDGYELAAMIRQHPRYQQTAIIFVSAVLMTDLDRLRGYECGAVDYVPVPVVPEILRAKVSIFAELYRKTRALERLNARLEQRVAERTAELEATTSALREAGRRKDEFLAMLAHELRNPLAPIRTSVQLLRRDDLSDADRTLARAIIERQVDHLVTLIDDLLDVSRITRGKITLQRKPVALGAIVARAVETARPLIDAHRHQLVLEISDEPLTIDGDTTRLVQVVGNLLHNASKFTEPGGRIWLSVTREGREAVIRVRDTGIGMSPDLLPKLFELFTQGPSNEMRTHGGLGIGLALVRRLTEMHGGAVTASSAGLGRGSEFTVRLPIIATESTRPADVPAEIVAARSAEPRRILVADDNGDAAAVLSLQLQLSGHEVRTVDNGVEALAVANHFQPDLVLLDLGMPQMDGLEAAREMRRQPWGERATLVAVTGWGQQQDRDRTAEAGFDVHLVKPVAEKDLARVVALAGTHRQKPSADAG